MIRIHHTIPLLAAALCLAACHHGAPEASTSASAPALTPAAQINWREGSVDEAFAEAKEKNKPVLLYWGARWCPPCNQLKATVFTRPEFIQQTNAFVAVHLDGDSPGAQKWGEYFGIVGYPTMIVLRSDKTELMRLSGGTDVEQFPRVLSLALRQTSTAAELRDRALSAPKDLSADDWTLLANYGWEVDAHRLSGSEDSGELLDKLANACPIPELKTRFAVLALASRAAAADKPETLLTPDQQASAQSLLMSVLADPAQLRASHDELSTVGAPMIAAASSAGSPGRAALVQAWGPAMDKIYADESLPVLDRLYAVQAEVDVFHLQNGDKTPLPPALIDKARSRAAWADQQSKTPFDRQAVVSSASDLLESIGDNAQAEQMLTAELSKSQAPYYYMPHLSDLAKQRGDNQQAVDWLRRAYEASDGPATRAQWGVSYVRGLIELTPQNADAIEKTTTQIIDEVAANPDSYYQRTRMRFDKLSVALEKWGATNHDTAVLQHLHAHMQDVCGKLPSPSDALSSCQGFLSAAA